VPEESTGHEPEPDGQEQLRRLKNTIMGASHRLSELARTGPLAAHAADDLASISRELAGAAQRLERLLAALRRDR